MKTLFDRLLFMFFLRQPATRLYMGISGLLFVGLGVLMWYGFPAGNDQLTLQYTWYFGAGELGSRYDVLWRLVPAGGIACAGLWGGFITYRGARPMSYMMMWGSLALQVLHMVSIAYLVWLNA